MTSWEHGFKAGRDSARAEYFVRGCLVGGAFTCFTIFALTFFLGAP